MFLFIILTIACVLAIIYSARSARSNQYTHTEQEKPARRQLTDAEREAIRQADEVFDWDTHNAIVSGTYNGPLPEYDGAYWSLLYPDTYTTKIAGINFCRGIKDLAGMYFDCRIEADPKNKYDANAIKIVHKDSRKLGYIPADETDEVREFLNNQLPCITCRAHVDEGEDVNYDTGRTRHYLIGTINIHRKSTK